MTIEELFIKEYQEQKETIKTLYKRIADLQAQYNELLEVSTGDVKARDQYKDAILDEIKDLGLYFTGMFITSDQYGFDKDTIKSRFPILTSLGLINIDKGGK